MAVRSALLPVGAGVSNGDRDAAVVADGVSKRYAGPPEIMFPPVVSIFDRDLFKRKRSSADGPPRRPRRGYGLEDDDDEDEEDFEEDEQELEERVPPTTARPGPFWALRDVSFRVHPGEALGVLGGPDSGKSTLLRILGGRSFATEGRVLVRDPVSPFPADLARALRVSSKGEFDFDLVFAARLLGIDAKLVKAHRDEIEELAEPLRGDDGEPEPGWATRLAVATAVVLPASVILLEESRKTSEAFTEPIIERVRERLRSGSSLVLASRKPELARALCDEAISLDQGEVVDSGGGVEGALSAYEPARANGGKGTAGGRPAGGRTAGAPDPSGHLWQGRKLQVPDVVTPFNALAALLNATVLAPTRSKRIAAEELSVEIRLETAVPDVEADCGVSFTPANGDTGVRLDLPEPLRFVEPGEYVLVARALPRTLRTGRYDVRAEAIVSSPSERRASVIARDVGRIRVVGVELDAVEPDTPPVPHWDGSHWWKAEAEWSLEE